MHDRQRSVSGIDPEREEQPDVTPKVENVVCKEFTADHRYANVRSDRLLTGAP